ncbi:dinitrogenase iron-molybdenum cofactor biosynthesis protein [candidate division WOR-1 bacterium RIFOXYB2_FULL_42_35]|uniref:Dinitrogenase iron-molybdenum cofactor biosynthesis protein n=1 Tax=candidate division WOR-1 bacterium RIFOXYC2_FULL_41_25 TaxID=1802586 RepID=A0A1F4TLN9_UNCSA|nr:MAG: dinitrogenase iron-molybdenum cofactor biosynthesis protein [candidate division WOR-1 bacterium RIFOXYB2_FULL_42_35]OGC23079.1 MAG: dinitrogenase iron-molybdenum cofactor biosynthesis protein [candidate division WOR-1 bacterium RIFOXYA2_FULL_41_14]OGC33651.1 MAG: dinitrogenase iron-molybdenum cofactor biosynthesis protein [candidate division WOR-1 bacterium RIFOXYC2_FULL_41_25]OGC43614.1 MAG: dinitrogenase iron-molybdenum cofactor biosynthesis protein [candidate division WOR-1 bacterium 
MKVCITASGNNLDSVIDPRFGRCQNFIIVDPETLEFKSIPNPNIDSSGGAGIQSGQLVASEGAKAILTGNVGPNAFQTLSSLGLKVFTGVSGTVKEALELYKEGKLKETGSPSVDNHFGTGESK